MPYRSPRIYCAVTLVLSHPLIDLNVSANAEHMVSAAALSLGFSAVSKPWGQAFLIACKAI